MARQTEIQLHRDYEPRLEVKSNEPAWPKVVTQDVATIVRRVVRPDDEDVGSSVALVAEKAETSTRTVYRVLAESTPTINLDLADRLCLAVGSHLAACRLAWPDGGVTPYVSAEFAEVMAG